MILMQISLEFDVHQQLQSSYISLADFVGAVTKQYGVERLL